jgi:hypothetical protein
MSLPIVPLWAAEQLQAQADRRDKRKAAVLAEAPDAPPVRLSGTPLRRWQGDAKAFKASDRSSRLVEIARDLARGNASNTVCVKALEERDRSLGLNKFTERSDGPVRYAEIVEQAYGPAGSSFVRCRQQPRARPRARPEP